MSFLAKGFIVRPNPMDSLATHVVIPDTQAKPGVPTDHLAWIGNYIVDHFAGKPDVKIIHLGDHADMPSLSSYDKGKKSMEGRRYLADIEAANHAFDVLNEPLVQYNARRIKNKEKQWWPERHILYGNHEFRIIRAAEDDAQLEGLVSLDALNYEKHGWTTHPFLEPFFLDGVGFSHYWANPMSGRPFGGMAATRLKTLGHSFTMGHQQTLDYAVRFVRGREGEVLSQHGLVAGACLTPDHKVLTADLRYVELGSVRSGDQLVSFDENVSDSPGRSRRYKTGTVLAVKREPAPVFEVELSDGKVFRATGDHKWLSKLGSMYVWRTTDSLRRGTRLVKPLDEWETLSGYEAGYLAGMYDGEGCYYTRSTQGGKHTVAQLGLSQLPGVVLDTTLDHLYKLVGVDSVTHTNQRGVITARVKGGTRGIAKVLGQVRPNRLLPKFRPEHLGSVVTRDYENPSVVAVRPAGIQEIVRIDIDAKTMIVEGYAHHNCYLHDEEYKGHQGNAHWRGIVVCHGVSEGSYNPMFLDLDYLCRRYEGVSLHEFSY